MSEITRRDALTRLATAFAATATIDYGLASEVHALLTQTITGPYAPRALSALQFRTLETLTDLIIPTDSGRAGALQAGVPAWIDSLLNVNADLKSTYVGGLAWLDATMAPRGAGDFVSATHEQRTALLDQIAFKKNASPELDAGIEFFALARRMTVDGFYTSPIGIREIIPSGRPPLGEFVVPQESVDYVISRSPFR